MIGYFMTVKDVGIYNAAVPIALLLNVAPEIFMQLFFPLVTKEYFKKNYSLVRELSKQVGKWIFIITLPVFVLIFLFPGAFINIIFGQEYLPATNALRFLSIGALFTTVFTISNRLISMKGKSKLILYDIIIATIINIFLNFILVPKYGITGASFATMTSLIFLNLLFFIQAKKYLDIIPIRRAMIKITIVSIIPAIVIFIARNFISQINIFWLITLFLAFSIMYIGLLFITRCFDDYDKMIIAHLKSKIPFVNQNISNID
jgi:O-antigen/teichoic acid export membrane protein